MSRESSLSFQATPRTKRCAIYTRKSTEEGLGQAFNSLHAQREACEAYALSQQHEGWVVLSTLYDDGGFSGGNMARPALQQLLSDMDAELIDVVLVYKVDRLSRSLADFARLIEQFDKMNISFVSVTQQFNTSSSMGRLTLNVLLSFAQFEREVTSERIRDKIAASKKKGQWMGGTTPLGFDVVDKKLVANKTEAKLVNHIFRCYLELGCVRRLKRRLDIEGKVSKIRVSQIGRRYGGKPFSRGALYQILKNPLYTGKVSHKGELFEGQHQGIVQGDLWDQVQTKLKRNRHNHRTRTNAKDPSLFAGLIEDDRGNPMSPTHTKKGNRRYRYYISQAKLQFTECKTGSVSRVSAKAVEDAVMGGLFNKVSDPHQLWSLIDTNKLSITDQAILISHGEKLQNQWRSFSCTEKVALSKALFQKIVVAKELITVHLRTHSLKTLLITGKPTSNSSDHPTPSEEDTVALKIPVQLRRCGIESKLVITHGDQPKAHPDSVKALQVALLKALRWNKALLADKTLTLAELGRRDNTDARYINYLLNLAYLAPDIMKSITAGNVPTHFSLEYLKKGFPLDWQHQRQRYYQQ